MLAYETNNSIEMVEKIEKMQGYKGQYYIYFNNKHFIEFATKEEAQTKYDELRKLFYSDKLKIIKKDDE